MSADAAVATLGQVPDRVEACTKLARVASITLLGIAPFVVGGAAVVSGRGGALGAAAGLVLVAVFFLGSLWVLRVGARRLAHPSQVVLLAGAGFCVRLLAYAVALVGLSAVPGLDRTAIAIGVLVGVVVTLVVEARAISTTPQLLWLDRAEPRADRR